MRGFAELLDSPVNDEAKTAKFVSCHALLHMLCRYSTRLNTFTLPPPPA